MASDIVTATAEGKAGAPASPPRSAAAAPAAAASRRRRGRRLSPLTRRILAVNILALGLLGLGLLYLGQYQQGLIAAGIEALRTQGQVFAAALGEGAVMDSFDDGQQKEFLIPDLGRQMMSRLVEPTRTRARLFDISGKLVADSRTLRGPSGLVQISELPPPDQGGPVARFAAWLYDAVVTHLPWQERYPLYVENGTQRAADYPEVQRALYGEIASAVRSDRGGGLVLSVAVPVQRYKQVLGAVLLSTGSSEIEQSVRAVRFEILKVFIIALGVTVLLSVYLAGTIAQPVRRLAAAAERVRLGRGRQVAIPDLTPRGDEIGDLSAALREMTSALWQRMDAIERFAADVAHEIKNPLTSLRSAVETATRLNDPAKQHKLLALVLEDIERLNRLITDISDASRLDAELSRGERESVPIARMLETLVDVYRTTRSESGARLELDLPGGAGVLRDDLPVLGIEDRLVQVLRNLIANAISFSPPGGVIRIAARRLGEEVEIAVEDDGPGIPDGKLDAIFERFYSERPKGEKFGTHSGLGLSISQQIIAAHRGSIRAENRRDVDGSVQGARFIVRLPTT